MMTLLKSFALKFWFYFSVSNDRHGHLMCGQIFGGILVSIALCAAFGGMSWLCFAVLH